MSVSAYQNRENKWQEHHQMVLCIHECLKLELRCGTIYIQTPTFIMHAASLP